MVATLHSWSLLQMDEPEYGIMCYMYRSIVDAGVPLFVLISGALILASPIESITVFLKKRLTRVLIPFVIWATIIYVLQVVRHQYDDIQSIGDAISNWIPYLLYNKINVSHWFVHMIVALYLLTPILQRVLQMKDGKSICEYMLAVIMVCLILRWFFPHIFILRYGSTLLGYLGLYLVGYYIAKYGVSFRGAPWMYGVSAILLYWVNVLFECPNQLLTQLTAVAIFATIMSLHITRPLPTCRIVVNVSRYSYLIYLVHIPIICAIYQFAHIETPRGWMPVAVGIGVVALCAIGCWVLDRIPDRWKLYLGIAN